MSDVQMRIDLLTDAQRQSIIAASDMMSNHGGYPFMTVAITGDPWPEGVAEFLTLKTDRLTPLGLKVRDALTNSEGGGE